MVRFVQLYHPLPDHARWRHAEQYSRDLLQTTEEVDDESRSTTPHHVFICRRTHPGHCLGIFHGENPLTCSFNIILFDLVLMILITTMLRLLLKPLKQPRIVSEIIILETPTYTLMLLLTTLMTGTCSALICFIYDPTKQYMTNKRRTIQHTPPGTELCILVGIHDEECVAGLINLLETSHPTMTSPFAVYAIHLFELVGRAFPVFIDHDKPERPPKYINYKKIHNALKIYQKPRSEYVKLRSYTVATVKRTMHQDICDLALTYKATLILLPFCNKRLHNLAGSEIVRHVYGMQSINSRVLANSPCSIGILVDKGYTHNPIAMQYYHQLFFRRCVVLFLGGADSREALAYADRMATNPEVSLTAIRFLSYNNIGDDEMEKKLDDGVVTWFWVKNEGNSRVAYREVVVRNGEETLAAIQALDNDNNELWIVGRKQGINQVLLEGLSKLSENPELGVIGDYVASTDFGSTASVLVVHQQIMRG